MELSAIGRACLIAREGRKLVAYQDSVGVWTIGVGHTTAAGPPSVIRGLTITPDQCDEIFARDVLRFALPVLQSVKVPLEDHQADALISFAFNVGASAFKTSTLLRRLNAADYKGAADAFMMWTKPAEITSRREAEREQFITPYSVEMPKARSSDLRPIPAPSGGNAAPTPPVQRAPLPPLTVPAVKPAPQAAAQPTGFWSSMLQRLRDAYPPKG